MPSEKSETQLPTASRVMLRIALIIGVVESLIMACFNIFEISPLGVMSAISDAVLLVVLASPLLYILVVRPYYADREQQHSIVEFLAHHDELTKLSNRRLFDEHLKRCLPSLTRHGYYGALIYFDLDGFKPINDEYGHGMGDRVLVELSSRLSKSLRDEEVLARMGGDEFALLIGNAGKDRPTARHHANELALRVQRLVQEPLNVEGLMLQVSCSQGVHILEPNTQDAHLAIKAADTAMYQAKRARHGSIIFSDSVTKPSYEIVKIGVIEIDSEHREIDKLLASLLQGGVSRENGVALLLETLKQHFHSEVRISKRLGLNMTKEHITEHAQLLHLLRELDLAEDEPTAIEQLTAIGLQFQQHVFVYDRSLLDAPSSPFLQQQDNPHETRI